MLILETDYRCRVGILCVVVFLWLSSTIHGEARHRRKLGLSGMLQNAISLLQVYAFCRNAIAVEM